MPVPTHRIEIHKHIGSEKWVNTYEINAASMAAAETAAAQLGAFERALHYSRVIFDYARVSTITVGDRVFDHVVFNSVGLRTMGSDILLPLYCTLRLDMQVNDSDPARKYYRGCLATGHVTEDFTIIDSSLAALQAIIDGHAGRPSLHGVVTDKGNQVTNQTLADTVQERQLHRRRKKKVVA